MMTQTDAPVRVGPDHLRAVVDVMTRAFHDDVVLSYLLPDASQRPRLGPALVAIPVRHCFRRGQVYSTADVVGAACWLPPGVSLGLWQLLRPEIIGTGLKLGWQGLNRFGALLSLAERAHKTYAPRPHWYLAGLGVEPSRQGQGIGSRLMQPILNRADESSLECYLETQSERNLPLYERHGFKVVHQGTLPHGPSLWFMLRPPQVTA
jgi:GNAT superfamily N-acetyltransferase